jgi:DNA-3-methyladenine glycosylase II
MTFTPVDIRKGLRFLCRNDPTLAAVVRKVGPFTLTPGFGRYEILVRSILSQQISVAAARTIRCRLQALLPSGKLTAKGINALTDDKLRSVGVSQQKQGYLRHLTSCTLDGTINFRRIANASDDNAIAELVQVKGIGRWTAQMFLMFSLGRIDIFAPDDLGLRNAIQKLYKFPDKPTRAQLEIHAERWRPYRTIASWYLWRSLEQNVVTDEYPV